jgi:nucleoside-diphosphate-sugar epimerase
MNVLVTGGTGFIGMHLIARLNDCGHVVSALVRSRSKAERLANFDIRMIDGDLQNDTALGVATQDQDLVVHAAGLVKARSEAEFLRVNRDGTERLLRAVAAAGKPRFVLVSSLAARGPSAPGSRCPAEEHAAPVTAYGRSKLAAEQVVRRGELPWTILRPPMVYGPWDTELLKAFKLARWGWMPVFGRGTQELSAIYAPDLADAIVAAAESDTTIGRTYSACHPEVFTSRTLARAVADTTGRSVRIVGLSERLARVLLAITGTSARLVGRATILDPDKFHEFFAPAWTGDSTPLTRDTGWRAGRGLADGLCATAAWYRKQRWI